MRSEEQVREVRLKQVAKVKKWKADNPERWREYCRNYYRQDPEKWREYHRKYYKNKTSRNPIKRRDMLVAARKRLGLPEPTRPCPETCECCGKAQTGRMEQLSLDHCHKTKAFRGWLCNRCNLAIGLLDDSLETVNMAVAYLERFIRNHGGSGPAPF